MGEATTRGRDSYPTGHQKRSTRSPTSSAYPKARWIHTLIRNIKEWTTRDHGRLDYWVTQVLSGHGCFGAYLFKYKKRSDPTCQDCGTGWDDAEHAFFRCRVYMEEPDQLQQSIGAPLEPDTVVEVMLRGPESWDKIACTSGT